MENIGIINCKYHPQKLNVSWCSQCGTPLCENCVAEVPKWIMGFGYPDICPRCKQKKINFALKILLISYIPALVILFIINFFIFTFYTFYISGVGISGLLLYFIAIIFKERKKYQFWIKTIDERSITDEEIQKLIQNQKLVPCKYHSAMPSINECDDCGIDICVNCSITYTRFLGAYISCMECFWKKRKRVLKIFMWFFGIPLVLLLVVFFLVTIVYWSVIHYSFYLVYSLTCLFYGIIFTCLFLYYRKTKKKYNKWTGNDV